MYSSVRCLQTVSVWRVSVAPTCQESTASCAQVTTLVRLTAMSAAALCSPSVLSAVAALRSAQQASRDAERAHTAAKAAEVTATRVFLAAAAVEGAFPPEHAAVAAEPVAEPTYACSSQPIRRSPAQLLRMRRHRELARKRYGDHAMLAHLVECDRLRAVARREEHQRQEEERKQEEELQEQEHDSAAHLLHRLEDNYPSIVPREWVE